MKKLIAPLLLAFAPIVPAATIVSAVDNGVPNSMQLNLPGSATTAAAVVSWTQASAFTNVNVEAYLFGGGSPNEQYTAYLTNAIGPAATAVNNIAPPITNVSQTFVAPAPGTPTTLFSGLSLGAGTYYLVIQSLNTSSGGFMWESKAGLSPTFGAGVSGGQFYLASSDAAYGLLNAGFAPGSVFAEPFIGGSVMYTVTGEASSATPEPLSLGLCGAGLLAIGLARRRRN
jgi:hypothetical protein